jgi:hypothetical protein
MGESALELQLSGRPNILLPQTRYGASRTGSSSIHNETIKRDPQVGLSNQSKLEFP